MTDIHLTEGPTGAVVVSLKRGAVVECGDVKVTVARDGLYMAQSGPRGRMTLDPLPDTDGVAAIERERIADFLSRVTWTGTNVQVLIDRIRRGDYP